MKKSMLLLLTMILLTLLAACKAEGTMPESLQDEDQLATIVAGTLSAPTTTTFTPSAVASSIPSLGIEDFPDKVFLGEDERFSVYLINSNSGDAPEKTGEIIIYEKGRKLVHQITGSLTFFGTTIVSNDDKGEYILLSQGTYTSRKAIVIALSDKRQAVNEFCTTNGEYGDHLFWNDYVIFNNCDTFQNRPWGAGEAPSIVAINLKTGLATEIAKSDLTHHFHVQAITANSLDYLETSVEGEEDWQNPGKQNTVARAYDLSTLEINN